MYKFRIFAKATILSLLHFSPLPLFSAVLFSELFFLVSEARLTKIKFPKLWLATNVTINASLFILVLFSSSLAAIFTSAGLVVVTLILEFIRVEKEIHLYRSLHNLKISNENLNESNES